MTRRHPRRRSLGGASTALALLLILTAAVTSSAQTSFAPYHGKNRIKYDKIDWHIYTTDHFEIYYYPDLERHLERVASYAESAYQQVSADLKHDLAFPVPLIVFKTHSEFEQQNVFPGGSPEGVGAFAEPQRNRIVLPIDEPPDGLYRLITHELTHIFEFDIIPRSLIRRSNVPLWVDEGLADYMAGVWRPTDMMQVRDVAVTDSVPDMSNFERYGGFASGRVVYNLGHAAFEFIEDGWGKEGIRQFLLALRRSGMGVSGDEDAYEEALDLSAEDFDDGFKKYLDDRFEIFRDKERPSDYGRNLAPDSLQSQYPVVVSIESSPSGEVIAAMALNRKDQEFDIVLLSAHSGEIIENLTSGFDQSYGFEYVAMPGQRFNTVPWMSWSPDGDRLAYFVRKGKYKSLVIQNVVTRNVEQLIDLQTVDEPEAPDFSPTGEKVVFSALRNGVGDIFEINLATQEIRNVTNDEFANYSPVYSPDGSSLVIVARVSANNKLFRLDLQTENQTQLTFGTFDEMGTQFIDDRTIVFASTATDPTLPLDPQTARDAEIFNIWTLDLENGELRQHTDTATGNLNPVLLAGENGSQDRRIGFISYFKGEYGLHTLPLGDPLYTASASDFGGPGSIIDFQAPLSHLLVGDNSRKVGRFENMFLEGRPPIGFGVTSSGDLLGGTQITFSDLLGDQQFSVMAMSVSQYRTLGFSYANLASRFQFAIQGYSQDQFFYGFAPGSLFDPNLAFLSRDDAIATRTVRGGSIYGIYPFDRFRRIEFSAGVFNYQERFNNAALEQQSNDFQQQYYGAQIFRNGMFLPLGISFVQETTVFREYGPLSGNTMRVDYVYAPSVGNLLSRQTVDLDTRFYQRLGENGVLALRSRAFKSWGEFPDFLYFGGNSEMRGYDYLQFLGHETFYGNAELRFPLIEAMATPIGVLGGVRGTFFFNFGFANLTGQETLAFTREPTVVRGVVGSALNPDTREFQGVFGPPVAIDGIRLVDSRASYGFSLSTMAIGFPVHFDWAWRTLFNKAWEDVMFSQAGGSEQFRRVRFAMWVGYDF